MSIGGSLKDGLVNYIGIYITPCQKTSPADTTTCTVVTSDGMGGLMNVDLDPAPNPLNPLDPAVIAAATLASAVTSEFLRDYTVSLGQIQDSPGLEDFDKPLIRNLIFTDGIKVDLVSHSEYRFHFSEVQVITTSGFVTKHQTTTKGLTLDSESYLVRGRNFFDTTPTLYEINGVL